MRGIVMQSKKSEKGEAKLLDSANINIYNGDHKLLVTFTSSRKGKCDFRLPLDKKFIIEVTRKGFVTKFLEVDSKVPKEKKAAYIFPFSIDIFEDVKGLDVSILKKPIAKINYSFSMDHFAYDYSYTDRINKGLEKMYKDFYFLNTVVTDLGSDSVKVDNKNPKDPKKKGPTPH